jgi:hypothetical protein
VSADHTFCLLVLIPLAALSSLIADVDASECCMSHKTCGCWVNPASATIIDASFMLGHRQPSLQPLIM